MEEKNQNINNENLTAAIEAILFVYGEPLEIKKIIKILGSDTNFQFGSEKEAKEIIKISLEELSRQYTKKDRGLQLILYGDKVQLSTKPAFTDLLEKFIKEEFKEQLTPASLETLTLITYLGPLSRAQIDFYRGVNSSFILRNLLIRGLIERFFNTEKSQTFLYQASIDLLKYLGISKIEELPEYEKYKSLIKNQEIKTEEMSQ